MVTQPFTKNFSTYWSLCASSQSIFSSTCEFFLWTDTSIHTWKTNVSSFTNPLQKKLKYKADFVCTKHLKDSQFYFFSTWCRKTQSLDWVQNKIKFHVKNMYIQDSKKLICRFFSPINLVLHISKSKSRKWLAFKTNGHWWQTVSKNTAMHFSSLCSDVSIIVLLTPCEYFLWF